MDEDINDSVVSQHASSWIIIFLGSILSSRLTGLLPEDKSKIWSCCGADCELLRRCIALWALGRRRQRWGVVGVVGMIQCFYLSSILNDGLAGNISTFLLVKKRR